MNAADQMEKLREYAEWGGKDSTYQWALDEVESLRAERERLREALERIAATEPDFGFVDDWQAAYSGALVIARTALAVESEEELLAPKPPVVKHGVGRIVGKRQRPPMVIDDPAVESAPE